MNWKISAVLVTAFAAQALGQEAPGAEGPKSGPPLGDGPHAVAVTTASLAKRVVRPAVRVALNGIDVQPLLDEDALRSAATDQKSDPRVGVFRTFREVRAPKRFVPRARGVATMSDGSLVWSAEVNAPGAIGLRLHVSQCDLPDGATVIVRDADDATQSYGPFEGVGPNATGAFYLPTVFAAAARVEVRVPRKRAGEPVTFAFDAAAQRYRERGEGLADPRVGTSVAAKPGDCNNDVACDSNYVADVARGVATMEITTNQGVFLCSGALLNDSDESTVVPYFLTAHHCVSTSADAQNTEFYFDYRAATCGAPTPSLASVPRTAGASLLATSASSDFTFLKLTGALPSNRFFCGWTAAPQPVGEAIVGVHHPQGGKMRISYGTLLDPSGNFHQVQWSDGVTAPGSSGSPLFNPQKQVIGQLYGGSSACSLPDGIDEYGRFDRTYVSVSKYLGAGATGTTTDSNDPTDDTIEGATLLVPGFAGDAHGPHLLSKDDVADWFAFDLTSGWRYRFFSTGVDDLAATLYYDQHATIVAASDAGSAGTRQFAVDFTPAVAGRYWLKVTTGTPGGAAEYSLHYELLDSTLKKASTKSPAAVQNLRKSVRNTLVTLKWTDGARNRAGYFVELSRDGGATWSRVGELPRDARSFQNDPGAGLHVYRVGAWNTATFPAPPKAPTPMKWRKITANIVDVNQLDMWDSADDVGSGATTLAPSTRGSTPSHTLSRADLVDWYRIDLSAGATYVFQSTGGGDTYGELFDDAAGAFREAVDDDSGTGMNFRFSVTAPRTGTYWLRVTPNADGAVMTYALSWRQR